jgi:dihydroorotate dehydrogenase electron transfer subunit
MSADPHRCLRVRQRIAEGVVGATLVLDGGIKAEPGQFVMVWLPGIEERPLAVVGEAPLRLCVQVVGPFTRALADLAPGERVWVRGPYGHGFQLGGSRHLLVGGGSGVASLALLAEAARRRGDAVWVILGARTGEQMMLAWRFAELGCELTLTTDDGSRGLRGTVVDGMCVARQERWLPETIYACGPEAMLLAVARESQALGAPCQVSLERVMKCGLGVCGHCHCGEWLVCQDGPVFDATQVRTLLEMGRQNGEMTPR